MLVSPACMLYVCVCRYGRVNFVLAQRLELLQEVSRLQQSLEASGDMSYKCETAGYFYIYQVCSVFDTYDVITVLLYYHRSLYIE